MLTGGLPPFLIFLIAGLCLPLLEGRARLGLMLLVPLAGGLNLLGIDGGSQYRLELLDYDLVPVRIDRLSLFFGYLFHIAAFLGVVFSLHVRDGLQQVAAMVYAGSALGAVFAGDLLTLFVFWESMTLASTFLVWAGRSRAAIRAGFRYLVFQFVAGLLMLAGILIHLQETGSIAFDHLGLSGPGTWLIFVAFGIKAGFPLLHNWLTDAYPEATPTGTVFLSAFTTKVSVYALARAYAGTEALIYIGAVMTCFPIFYAVIENDLRRVLSYSMINQIGFMVCGIGIGTELALNGAISHAFNEVIFKGLLFMSMGAVLHMSGKIRGSELGGLYKTMPVTTGLCIVGACSISAFPLFSGFVSKSMVMLAALRQGHEWVWVALLFASAGVFHHAGIKVPFFAFFARDSGIRAGEPPLNMLVAMGLAAALCLFIGCYPWVLYELLPFGVDYQPYTYSHVIAQLQLLFFAALAFAWLKLRGLYPPELPSVNLDAEWAYRWLAPRLIRQLARAIVPAERFVRIITMRYVALTLGTLARFHGPRGILARTWATGSMVLWVVILLFAYLVSYYV
jgi:multicomponent Na+:H+ antiporter subunit D